MGNPDCYIDISVPIRQGMVTYPGDPDVVIEPAKSIAKGDYSNVSHLHLGSHTGSHLDVPGHFGLGGPGPGDVPLDVLMGSAVVVDVGDTRAVTPEHVRGALQEGARRVLIRSRNRDFWNNGYFHEDFTYLTGETARALVDAGVRLVGVDYLSVDKYHSEGAPAHRALLEAGVVVLEGLDLSAAEAGPYELICLPLRLVSLDGSPVRAVLRKSGQV